MARRELVGAGGRDGCYQGHFVRLVPDREVVEAIEFETDDPGLRGEMTVTTTLRAVPGGTEVSIEHRGLPAAVSPADNETGTRMALARLAALLEPGNPGPDSPSSTPVKF
jgi:uncharacterized protein YndB with AHSA1/START domain